MQDRYSRAASRDIGRDAIAYTSYQVTEPVSPRTDRRLEAGRPVRRRQRRLPALRRRLGGDPADRRRLGDPARRHGHRLPPLPLDRRVVLGLGTRQQRSGRRPRHRQVARRPTPSPGALRAEPRHRSAGHPRLRRGRRRAHGLGYVLVDLATPGKLHELIWTERNRNAALLLASNLLGVGIIVVAAIVASDDDFALGLVGAAAYGIVGLVIMAAAFLLLDAVTPGKLGELLVDPEPHPAVWVVGRGAPRHRRDHRRRDPLMTGGPRPGGAGRPYPGRHEHRGPAAGRRRRRGPAAWRLARAAVLVAVFVCAACGLVYELALVTLGSYLIGNTVAQASIVLGVMVFAMGIGVAGRQAAAAPGRWPRSRSIELAAGPARRAVGARPLRRLRLARPLPAGAGRRRRSCVGAAHRRGDPAADGAAAAHPRAGRRQRGRRPVRRRLRRRAGRRAGLPVPAAAGLRPDPGRAGRRRASTRWPALAVVCAVFRRRAAPAGRGAALGAGAVVVAARAWWYACALAAPVRGDRPPGALRRPDRVRRAHAATRRSCSPSRSRSAGRTDLRLFLNGDLQFSSVDEYRYHEALVHPAHGRAARGGCWSSAAATGSRCGRCCATRTSREVTLVELDPAVLRLARTDRSLARAQRRARSTTRACGWSTPTRSPGCGRPPSASTR